MPPPTRAQLKRSAAAVLAFHNHFSSIYGHERWHNSLYPALLASTRYAALLTSPDTPIDGEQVTFLTILCLQRDQDTFLHPISNSHYNLDAASLLAVQVLDVQSDHKVLDLCAAPGGKSIAIGQKTCVHANEFDQARHKRLEANLKYYLPHDKYKLLNLDGTRSTFETYDRVLVDAPCSSERHVIHAQAKKEAAGQLAEEMGNWKPSQRLPKTQCALLMTALKAVKTGGKVVYATCSISTQENDGVIERCLQLVKKEDWTIEVEDSRLDDVAEKTTHGSIALPDHKSGGRWGPIYFAVIKKIAPTSTI
jgi:16S rRNA C967 or C1407 C5-methylase (RsmB/RsmF family)